jgi:GntR family transcriptional repressor for pyruvate dehydrogenase complex
MPFEPEPVRPPRKEVEAQLREAIVSGAVAAGDKLPSEPELARMFSVSRSTVREALRSLAVAGMIKRIPGSGGGTFVQSIGVEQLAETLVEAVDLLMALGGVDDREIVDVRQMLEVPACRLAAVNRGEADIEEMRAVVEAEKQASVDDPAVPELDLRFHTAVARASDNRVLAALVQALHRCAHPVEHLDLRPEVGRATVRQHLDLLRAIKEQDPDAAETAIGRHLSYLREQSRSGRASSKDAVDSEQSQVEEMR